MKNYNKTTINAVYEGTKEPRTSTSNANSVYWELYFSTEHKQETYRFYVPVDSSMDNFANWDTLLRNAVPGDVYTVLPMQKRDGNAHLKNNQYLLDADYPPKYVPSIFDTLFK